MRFAAFVPACPPWRAPSPSAALTATRNPPTWKTLTSSRPGPCASPSTFANAAIVFIVCAAPTRESSASTTSCPASRRGATPIATWFPLVSNVIRSKASVPPPIFSAGSTASAASPSPNSTPVSAPSTPSLPASSPLPSTTPTPPSVAKAARVFRSAGFQPASFFFYAVALFGRLPGFLSGSSCLPLKPPPRWRRYEMTSSTRSRGYLPHLETQEAIYFVTFRLADSLPRELVLQLRKERDTIEKASLAGNSRPGDLSRLRELRALLKKVERCLDRGMGCCHLRDSRVAGIAAEALRHFHGRRYRLLAWCVMPNHVHVLFSPLREHTLEAILHSWKSYSAQKANALLGRTGPFWQREYFDHLVRDQSSLRRITQYIQDNPKRAGLLNWPWVEVLP